MLRLNNLVGFGAGGVGGNDPFTKILLHFDGANGSTTFPDTNAGGSAHTWTASSAAISTANGKFGPSLLCAAGGVSSPDNADFSLGSQNWAVDFWINRNGNVGVAGLFGQGNSTLSATSIAAGFTSGNAIALSVNGALSFSTAFSIADSAFHHVAFSRSGATIKAYLDGIIDANSGSVSGAINDPGGSWWVGARGDFASAKNSGYMDEFRLSVGTARYAGNFTPASAAYS